MSLIQGPAVNIIAGQGATAVARKKLAGRLGEIGVSSALWDPSVNFRDQPMVLIRQAANRPIFALIFLGEVPGVEFETAKSALEREYPIKVFKADPEHPETVIGEVKTLLGHTSWLWQVTSALTTTATGVFRHALHGRKA